MKKKKLLRFPDNIIKISRKRFLKMTADRRSLFGVVQIGYRLVELKPYATFSKD